MAKDNRWKRGEVRAALYVRASTADQANNGASLAAQEERLRAYCAARKWAVYRVYRDDASGATLDRPQLSRLLEDAKAGKFEAICVAKLDRLTRSIEDLGRLVNLLVRQDIALVSLGESIDASTGAGKLVINVLGSIAQWEREVVGERTREVLRHKRDSGQVYGVTPYGFVRRGDRLIPLPWEVDVVRRIYRLREKGRTIAAIAAALNRKGIPTKRRREWAPATVHYILRNRALYGRFVARLGAG